MAEVHEMDEWYPDIVRWVEGVVSELRDDGSPDVRNNVLAVALGQDSGTALLRRAELGMSLDDLRGARRALGRFTTSGYRAKDRALSKSRGRI
jgi:hypothetical protein